MVCCVRVDVYVGVKGYKFEVWINVVGVFGELKCICVLIELCFEYLYFDVVVDGVGWSFIVVLCIVVMDGLFLDLVELFVENVQILIVVFDVEVFVGYLLVNFIWNKMELVDYVGVVICMDMTFGFMSGFGNQVFDLFGKVGVVLDLISGVIYYFCLVVYDVWGMDDFFFGSIEYEVIVLIFMVIFGEILGKLCDVLIDLGNVDGNLILNVDCFVFQVVGIDCYFFIIGEVGGEDVIVFDFDVIIGGNVLVVNFISGVFSIDVLMMFGGGMIVIDGVGVIIVYKVFGIN